MSGAGGGRRLHLENKEGKCLNLLLRQYREGDEEGMIACIRDEYGDTYFKRGFYDPAYLKKEAAEGNITFLVAETEDDGIAGMLILKELYPEEAMCEVASQIFRKKYRGYGLAAPFFDYGMEILLSRHYSAAFCLPVLFHDVTQRLLYRLGFRATGLVLNVFDMGNITHSYLNGRNTKHSQGIQVQAVEKQDAGTIYIPEEHREFCQAVYDSLGVSHEIRAAADRTADTEGIPPFCSISHKQDDLQNSLEIRIHQTGADLPEQIRKLHSRYPLTGKQTANVFLNINDRHAVWAYERLGEAGYFFTGLKPLCSEREYMVLHHPGEVETYLEDYVVSEEFGQLIKFVKIGGRNMQTVNAFGKNYHFFGFTEDVVSIFKQKTGQLEGDKTFNRWFGLLNGELKNIFVLNIENEDTFKKALDEALKEAVNMKEKFSMIHNNDKEKVKKELSDMYGIVKNNNAVPAVQADSNFIFVKLNKVREVFGGQYCLDLYFTAVVLHETTHMIDMWLANKVDEENTFRNIALNTRVLDADRTYKQLALIDVVLADSMSNGKLMQYLQQVIEYQESDDGEFLSCLAEMLVYLTLKEKQETDGDTVALLNTLKDKWNAVLDYIFEKLNLPEEK